MTMGRLETRGNQSEKLFCLTQNLFGNNTKDSKVSIGLAGLPENIPPTCHGGTFKLQTTRANSKILFLIPRL